MNYRSEEQRFDAEQDKLFELRQEQEEKVEEDAAPDFDVCLRPYQVEAVRAAMSMRDSNPLIVMATGLGKTTVFCEIILRRLAEDP